MNVVMNSEIYRILRGELRHALSLQGGPDCNWAVRTLRDGRSMSFIGPHSGYPDLTDCQMVSVEGWPFWFVVGDGQREVRRGAPGLWIVDHAGLVVAGRLRGHRCCS